MRYGRCPRVHRVHRRGGVGAGAQRALDRPAWCCHERVRTRQPPPFCTRECDQSHRRRGPSRAPGGATKTPAAQPVSASYSLNGRRAPLAHRLAKVWRPALYQDGRKQRGYFEGWYFKSVDAAGAHPVAVIPGVALDANSETSHAFVQLIRADASTAYWEYPADEFRFSTERFEIEVGPNSFSEAGLSLALDGRGGYRRGGARLLTVAAVACATRCRRA